MQITAQEEYGLRCMLQLARHGEASPCTIGEIAQCEGLSKEYAAKLLGRLHRAGLVVSGRGARGGYRLARAAAEISVAHVMEAMGGVVRSGRRQKGFCETFVGNREACVHVSNCSVRPLWFIILRHIRQVLQTLTLADLIQDEEHHMATKIEQFFQGTTATTPAPQ